MSWECPNREPHKCSLRQCLLKRQEYRRLTHLSRKESDNEKNKQRYHEKYKHDSVLMSQKRAQWKDYAQKQGVEWQRERSKKYRKTYSELSSAQRSRIRLAYTQWAQQNWGKRVEYARHYRRKINPAIGLYRLIADARGSGDLGELIQRLGDAIARLDEKGYVRAGQSCDGQRRLRLRK